MTKKQRKMLYRIFAGTTAYLAVTLITRMDVIPADQEQNITFLLYLIPYLIIGEDVLLRAIRNIYHGRIFDENFLMAIATVGAYALREYSEAAAVMLFYQIGELFQNYAVHRSRKSISELMDIRPDYANIEQNGQLVQVDPEEIAIGHLIVVKPGERIPLDGIVISGSSLLDTSALTGESMPRRVREGSDVISGCINKSGVLSVKVTKVSSESTVARILDLVENASNKKSKSENFITRFARYYTPAVVIGAALLAVIPPIFYSQSLNDWISRALIFLVISCPCALVISVPLSFFGGIGGASKCGILIKGSNYLETLAKVDTVVFDKTGTLTKGTFRVTNVLAKRISKSELIELAAIAEGYSDHPISMAIREEAKKKLNYSRNTRTKEIAGQGIKAYVDGHVVFVGNTKLMETNQIVYDKADSIQTVVYVARDRVFLGSIIISDEVKEDAITAVKQLKAEGVSKMVMLTGDAKAVAEKVGAALGLDEVHADLLPQQKVEKLEQLLNSKNENTMIAYVGDGINDAPVLSRADIGIAMGALGSDAAIEAADVVLMDDKPEKIAFAVSISRRTLRIVKQNIAFALGVKLFVLMLGAFGDATMWDAVFADVGVSVLAILNAMRTLSVKRYQQIETFKKNNCEE